MQMVKIVLFGVSLQSDNKGCEALAFSLFSMLNEALRRRDMWADVSSVVYLPRGEAQDLDLTAFERIHNVFLYNRKKSLQAQWRIVKAVREADLCIDMTEGDSFSDIYGKSRFYWRTAEKAFVLLCGKKLILGPQTYGPYHSANARRFAAWVLRRCCCICARDDASAGLVKEISGRTVCLSTDIAFDLPAETVTLPKEKGKSIAINVSGLLWNGGYTGNNQFGLKTDYRNYTIRLIEWCLGKGMEVWLIPHVIMAPDNPEPENDLAVCLALQKCFPACHVADDRHTPMAIKGLVSQMDMLIGARMHAAIAAFSCGVPVIPFAYSKKFGDLFGSLGYPFLIDGRVVTTEEALDATCKLIEESLPLREAVSSAGKEIRSRIDRFGNMLDKCLSDGVFL